MKNYGYIYIITFLDERSHLYNHYYIGQRKYRKNESLYDPNGHLYYHGSSVRACKEYWPYYNLHKKEIVCWCNTAEELLEKENEYIEKHINDPLCINCVISNKINTSVYADSTFKERISNSVKKLWNNPDYRERNVSNRKGIPSWNKGKHWSEEAKEKSRQAHKGKKASEETKKKMRDSQKKLWADPKQRQKISDARKGHTTSEETKKKISEKNKIVIKEYYKTHDGPNKGKTMSDEQKHKLSIAHKGKKLSEEHKAKIGNSLRGRKNGPLSEEHKKRISQANKGKRGIYKWMNDNINEVYLHKDFWGEFIDIGYSFGKLKLYYN